MRKGDEKTIKISADTDDLKRSFADLQDSYERVAKASAEYADAVDKSSKAVTKDELKAAKEIEAAHKRVLAAEKKRLSALKSRDAAMQASAKNIKSQTKSTDASAKSTGKLSVGMLGLVGVLASVGAGAAALSRQFAELDAANGRLANSIGRVGGTGTEMAAAEELATEMARRGQATRLESINSIRELIDASGSATTAMTDYRLAVDIASQANIGVSQATTMLAKARNGEVEELKNLRGLNKDLAQDLGKIEDQTLRSELAVQLLSESYNGAAEANAGLVDQQNALSYSMDDLSTATGGFVSAIVDTGTGALSAVGQFFGLLNEGQDAVSGITDMIDDMTEAIRAVKDPAMDLLKEGGVLGVWLQGKSIGEVVSEGDSRRAKEAAAKKPKPDSGSPSEGGGKSSGPQSESKTTDKITEALKRQEEAKKKLRKGTSNLAKEKEKLRQQDEENLLAMEQELLLAEEEAERLNAEAEAQARLAKVKADANTLIEETNQRLQDELDLRHELEQQKIIDSEGDLERLTMQQELEKELFNIRQSGLSWEAKARAENLAYIKFESKLKQKEKKESADANKQRMEEIQHVADATVTLGAAALEQAGLKNAAIALESGKKVAYYTGESIASFAQYNIPAGLGYAAAAAQHAIVAGGSIFGGGGGAPKKGAAAGSMAGSSKDMPTQGSLGNTGGGASTVNYNLNVQTVAGISNQDARRIEQAVRRATTQQVGGRR